MTSVLPISYQVFENGIKKWNFLKSNVANQEYTINFNSILMLINIMRLFR